MCLGAGLAFIFCTAPYWQGPAWLTILAFAFGLPLAYLTITGGKLFSVTTSEKKALLALGVVAEERRLDPIISRFDIRWNGKRFSVLERNDVPADDLFATNSE